MVAVPVTFLTLYTVMRSQRLSDFLDSLSNERTSFRAKAAALASVWRRKAASETKVDEPVPRS